MTCKDCIHWDVCSFVNRSYNVPFATAIEHCIDFKDKSRFIELPCKVGDTVYNIEFGLTHGRGAIVVPCIVTRFDSYENGIIMVVNPTGYGSMTYGIHDFSFGKTTFLTYKEAEKALKESERNE